MAKVSAIILAAGLSQRMGEENKLFIPIKEKPMIKYVMDAIAITDVDEIIVVGSEYSYKQLEDLIDGKMQLVNNSNYKSGMTSSIKKGVLAAKRDNAYMICLGDQPFIKTKTYNDLAGKAELKIQNSKFSIIKPVFEQKQGNPVIFSSYYREEILNHEEPEGCKEIVKKNKKHIYLVGVNDQGILRDIDMKSDLSNG